MLSENCQLDPPRNCRTRFQNQLSARDITQQSSEIGSHLINLQRKTARKNGGASGRYQTGVDVGVPDLVVFIEEVTLTSAVLETGAIGIPNEDLEIKGEVELEVDAREGETRGDAVDAGRVNLCSGLFGLEESES